MNTKPTRVILALTICSMLAVPGYARGGFGGGGRSFGGGGGRSFGGGGRSFGGGGRDFGGGGRDFGGGGFGGRSSSAGRDFGGGFNSLGGSAGRADFGGKGFENRGGHGFENRGGQGLPNRPNNPITNHPNFPDHLPTDGGFGGISGLQNKIPHNINNTDLHNQGQHIRNSFNNDQFNHNQINNVNVNRYGPYHGWGGAYGSGWAHGYAHGYWNGAGCWGCPGWSQATMWTCMGLTSLTTFLGLGLMGAEIAGSNNKTTVVAAAPAAPASNTYITYEGDNVYVNGQPAGTAGQYYQQAQQLASQASLQPQAQQPGGYPSVAPDVGGATSSVTTNEKWAPLGVFSLAEPGQTQSSTMLQLAINQQGIVRGNYLNQLTNERAQIYGSLDKKTQRISWTIGQNNTTVFDTSLPDLVKEDTQVLVHFGPTNTQSMALLRLPVPADDSSSQSGSDPANGAGPTG